MFGRANTRRILNGAMPLKRTTCTYSFDGVNKALHFTLTFTYPLTARVVWAPQIISQPISYTVLCDLANSKPVHSLILSSHLFLCLCCVLRPSTVPCEMVLVSHNERETCPYHCNLRLFTMVRRSSCGPITCWILARTSSLLSRSLCDMRSILR